MMGLAHKRREEIAANLADVLDGYTTDIRYLAEDEKYLYYTGRADHLSDYAEGTYLEIRVRRSPDMVIYEDGYYYQVDCRPRTGWADEPVGLWRWATHLVYPVAEL